MLFCKQPTWTIPPFKTRFNRCPNHPKICPPSSWGGGLYEGQMSQQHKQDDQHKHWMSNITVHTLDCVWEGALKKSHLLGEGNSELDIKETRSCLDSLLLTLTFPNCLKNCKFFAWKKNRSLILWNFRGGLTWWWGGLTCHFHEWRKPGMNTEKVKSIFPSYYDSLFQFTMLKQVILLLIFWVQQNSPHNALPRCFCEKSQHFFPEK